MRYTITGGAGFIGSHLAKALVSKGHSVDVIDNLSTGSMSNLDDIKNKISFHKTDILDADSLEGIIQNTDGIFHHAALTSVPESFTRQQEYENVNVNGTENIFKIAKKLHVKVVFASSSSVYGDTKTIPTKESHKLDPINPYGITKLNAEQLATKYLQFFDVVGLRYYNVYGDTMPGAGVISKFYYCIQNNMPLEIDGDGKQLRDFVYIDDVVNATISSMEKNTGSCFINVGSGVATSILELANLFLKYSGSASKIIFKQQDKGNVMTSQADILFAKQLLGWKPQTTLEDWIKNLYKS
ncbi:NAD-binding protein [Nitrosotalea sinensis]|uniref:NAD-binding protein n=1 Tax=Nitrosotalea sinensis TaxID=1499975 RepID=A0A2H1EEN9_9ARCH|nr:NAD-dependent epimerase/dehydratase family protein [Candidatus Nitrosotalea sinensis]SHO42790.1 NAD-binding protein [Candidatus Nitrosotalea sinensis]